MPSFKNTASFGKRIEYWIIGLLLKEGLDVFVPLVDDAGIDALIRGKGDKILDLQIKARSKGSALKSTAFFGVRAHRLVRKNYYFLFYAERLEAMWFMSSRDFVKQSTLLKTGNNKGKREIWFNGMQKGKEYAKPRFNKWLLPKKNGEHDLSRVKKALSDLNN